MNHLGLLAVAGIGFVLFSCENDVSINDVAQSPVQGVSNAAFSSMGQSSSSMTQAALSSEMSNAQSSSTANLSSSVSLGLSSTISVSSGVVVSSSSSETNQLSSSIYSSALFSSSSQMMSSSTALSSSSTLTPYTYTANVAPIMQKYCTSCHGTSGGIGLESYADVKTFAEASISAIEAGTMPKGRTVTAAELQVLKSWFANNMPQ